MNPDTKEFEKLAEPIPEEKKTWPRFAIGEQFELNGVAFEIHHITRRRLILKPMGQDVALEEARARLSSAAHIGEQQRAAKKARKTRRK
jgi:virulence-associated protein VagC